MTSLVFESLHVSVIDSDVHVVGMYRVGDVATREPPPIVFILCILDHGLLIVESVEEVARI